MAYKNYHMAAVLHSTHSTGTLSHFNQFSVGWNHLFLSFIFFFDKIKPVFLHVPIDTYIYVYNFSR